MLETLRSGLAVARADRARGSRSCSPSAVGARYCAAVSSGTAGLHLGMVLAGVGPGDEVITSPYLVRRVRELRDLRGRDAGLRRHRPAHVQPRSGRGRGGRHRADEGDRRGGHLRLPVRARPAARRSASGTGSHSSQDACEALGARVQGPAARLARPSDDVRVLSEQADDDGRGRRRDDERRGASTSCSSRCATRDGSRRARGSMHGRLGYNYRLDDVSAALGIGQVEKLDRDPRARAEVATRYAELLAGVDVEPPLADDDDHVRSLVRLRRAPAARAVDRDAVAAAHARTRRRDGALRPVDPPSVVHARALRLREGMLPGLRGLQRADARAAVPRASRAKTTRSTSSRRSAASVL